MVEAAQMQHVWDRHRNTCDEQGLQCHRWDRGGQSRNSLFPLASRTGITGECRREMSINAVSDPESQKVSEVVRVIQCRTAAHPKTDERHDQGCLTKNAVW